MPRDIIRVLSAGAPKTGISHCVEAFDAAHGRPPVAVTFATAPDIRKQMNENAAAWDVVVAPESIMRALASDGCIVADSIILIGTIAAGAVVRSGAPTPDISSVPALKAACLDADALVYNEASSGQRVAEMLDQLGIAETVAAKSVRVKTGRAVMERIAQGEGREIGFGQITEIRVHADRGVRLVGALPPGVEIQTTYAAGLVSSRKPNDASRAFIEFVDAKECRSILADAGVS